MDSANRLWRPNPKSHSNSANPVPNTGTRCTTSLVNVSRDGSRKLVIVPLGCANRHRCAIGWKRREIVYTPIDEKLLNNFAHLHPFPRQAFLPPSILTAGALTELWLKPSTNCAFHHTSAYRSLTYTRMRI